MQIFQRNLTSSLLVNTTITKASRSIINNRKYALITKLSESRNFVSLAWFGLWGKTPEKSKEPLNYTPETNTASSLPENVDVSNIANKVNLDETALSGYIPDPPPIVLEDDIILNALGEPTLQSLGLCSNWPTGWVQYFLELFHVNLGLSWISSIVLFTFCLRLVTCPFFIMAQQNSGKMKKISPMMNKLKADMDQANSTGNALEIQRATYEYATFLKANVSFFKSIAPMLQIPVVIGTFMGIKSMCNLPVESLQTSGMLWFPDLTVTDPYFLMPLFATGSLWLIVMRGIETGATNLSPKMKMLMYGLTVPGFFVFSYWIPSGVMIYVCTTNFISLLFAYIFSFDKIKKKLNIPLLNEFEKVELKEMNKKQPSLVDELKKFASSDERNKKNIDKKKQEEYDNAGKQLPIRTYKKNPKLNNSPKN